MTSPAKQPQSIPGADIPFRRRYGFEEVLVTPELAQQWLALNSSNREFKLQKIEQYQHDMQADGGWRQNGATICFSFGKLLDGQNRLQALINANKSIKLIVVYGLESDAQASMDTGTGRTAKDVLHIEGLDSWESKTLGTAIHQVMSVERGLAVHSAQKYTNEQVRDFYLEHSPALTRSLQRVKAYPRRHPLLAGSRCVSLHYIFSKRDQRAADAFFDRLMIGDDLPKSSPVFFLRQRLESDLHDGRTRSAYDQCWIVIKAWNSVRRGSSLRSGSSLFPRADENFPEII